MTDCNCDACIGRGVEGGRNICPYVEEEDETCGRCIFKSNVDAMDYICEIDGEPIKNDSFACDYFEDAGKVKYDIENE